MKIKIPKTQKDMFMNDHQVQGSRDYKDSEETCV